MPDIVSEYCGRLCNQIKTRLYSAGYLDEKEKMNEMPCGDFLRVFEVYDTYIKCVVLVNLVEPTTKESMHNKIYEYAQTHNMQTLKRVKSCNLCIVPFVELLQRLPSE